MTDSNAEIEWYLSNHDYSKHIKLNVATTRTHYPRLQLLVECIALRPDGRWTLTTAPDASIEQGQIVLLGDYRAIVLEAAGGGVVIPANETRQIDEFTGCMLVRPAQVKFTPRLREEPQGWPDELNWEEV